MQDDKAAQRKKRIKWGIIGGLILIAVILAIVLPITLSGKKDHNDPTPGPPGPGPGPEPFQAYNPYALDPKDISDQQSSFSGILRGPASYNQELHLQALNRLNPILKDGTQKLFVESKKIPQGPNNKFIQNLKFQFDMKTWRVAHLSMTDNDDPNRYAVPENAVPTPPGNNPETMRLEMLGFQYEMNPFSFSFSDPTNPQNVFLQTKGQSLVMMDKFIQMDFTLPSQRLYGLGERVRDFNIDEGTWTMWAIGLDSPYDDGTGRKGVYGVHPFVLVQTQEKDQFIGIFFRNSNAQSPVVKFNPDGTSTLSYITIGGQLDVYFFIHGTAKEIIQQYQQYFAQPNLPPFWSFGWQQASWKYVNQQIVTDVIDKYDSFDFPLETIYLDIPYMDKYADFTVDKKNFPDIQGLAKKLHDNNQKLVLIIDAALSAEDTTNKYYTMGNSDKAFIKSSRYNSTQYGDNLISKVWPEKAVFIDWFNEKCINVWSQGLNDLYNKVAYDGLWIDMNEPTTFVHGEIAHSDKQPQQEEQDQQPTLKSNMFLEADNNYDTQWYYSDQDQSQYSTFNLPFIPRNNQSDPNNLQNFDYMTLSLNATSSDKSLKQYDVHSLYGLMMASRTFQVVTSPNKFQNYDNRPFILTRSTFAGSGKYASHWLGDNWRKWEYMRYSIAGIMNMNMFGIPQAGADVCGFFGEKKDDEMCARWVQLATFYPLARAHQNLTYNNFSSDRTEPYLLNGKYKEWARQSIQNRYNYLRQMYTCMYEVSANGGTCFDPLFFHFPQDENTYKDYSSSFIVANAIKVSPVLDPMQDPVNQKTYKAYFPKGRWVSLNNYASIIDSTGDFYDLDAQSPTVQAHLKPGSLITYQGSVTATGQQVRTTSQLLDMPVTIISNRDEHKASTGSLFLDDGISRSSLQNKEFEYYVINHQAKSFQFQITDGARGKRDTNIEKLVIVDAADLKYSNFACYQDVNNQYNVMNIKYDEITNAVYITPLSPIKVSDILNLYYGQDIIDVNRCSSNSFAYVLADNQKDIDLSTNSTTIELKKVGGDLPNILVKMRVLQNSIVNVQWNWKLDQNGNPPEGKRKAVEVPDEIVNTNIPTINVKLSSFVEIVTTPQFQIKFKYRSTSNPSTVLTIKEMMFDSYYNYINVEANTPAGADFRGVLGLGERANKDFFLQTGIYSMWSRDQPTPDETGTLPGNNMYGTHPFYMYKHKTDAWVGVFYKLAHAQDWYVKNNKDAGTVQLTTIATGGVADIYVMQGKTPDDVVRNYFNIIGNPVLVPQWALGWNQCKWGYKTSNDLKDVVKQYDNYNIPLDVQWSDIDYLDHYRDFTYDKERFLDLPQFINDLHTQGRKYVPILDAGVAYRPNGNYPAFDEAYKNGLFVNINNEPFIGQVWPNDASFPDHFNPDTVKWFQNQLTSLWQQIQFDGLWEDMNEASNFCKGACYPRQVAADPVKFKLPYTPTGRDLEIKSMSLDSQHFNGYLQLDTHNYYGTQMVKTSHEWFKNNNKRTFIIERSSFAGMGKFGSRWLGDNFSEERFMGYSVSGTMLMNIFGITLAGSDICGFIGNTTAELCARWHVLGSFYPFSRNHNNWGQSPQEPWVFEKEMYEGTRSYMSIMIDAIKQKYAMIRYIYTNLFLISTQGSGTFYKPLFFEFPNDPLAYNDVTYNIMLGQALKLSINSEKLGQNLTTFYFPQGVWCDLAHPTQECLVSPEGGMTQQFQTKAYDYYLHLREGYIVPMQDTSKMQFKQSKDLQQQPIDLHILADSLSQATGQYVNDQGEDLDLTDKYNYYIFKTLFTATSINIKVFPQQYANNFKSKDDPDCYAVNQNDFLQTLFIYNAKAYQGKSMNVKAFVKNSQTPISLGAAVYDDASKRIIAKFAQSICLTKVDYFDIQ